MVQELDKATHARGAFRCGKAQLDEYLKRTARQAQAAGTGSTWVAVDQSDSPDEHGKRRVFGYYTVAMSSLGLQVLPEARRGGLLAQVPAALLARLAVDRTAQGQGLGELLLMDALRRIVSATRAVSAHAVVLDAMDEDAKRFYEQYGFLELTDDPLHLFLPMESVRAAFRPGDS